jgi:hypothetical protein
MKLTGAIAYHTEPNGTVSVTLLKPWDGKPRFPAYPLNIRLRVHVDTIIHHSYEETGRLIAADALSKDAAAAVRDDILCTRAARLMAKDVRFIRMNDAEVVATHAPHANCTEEPAWLKKVRSAFQSDEQQPDHDQDQDQGQSQ